MYEPEYEQTMEQPIQDDYEGDIAPPKGPVVISTSQAVNLTGTLAAFSALFALFLCFADQRSRAIRRFSIQSVGLGVIHLGVGMACWILSAILGGIPLLGYIIYLFCYAVFIGATLLALILRIRMAAHAYRGHAYVLPTIGEGLRRFE